MYEFVNSYMYMYVCMHVCSVQNVFKYVFSLFVYVMYVT